MKKYLQKPFSTRQYMLSKDFELFYYSDKHITPLKEHSHDYYEFYFFLGGEVSLTIRKKNYVLKKGDMIMIPPGISHYVNILNQDVPYQRFVFWISKDFARELQQISPDYGYLMQHVINSQQYIYHYDVISFNSLQSKLFQLSDEIHFNRFGKTAKIALLVNDLVLHLNRSVYEMLNPRAPKEQLGLYENLIDYIDRNLEDDLSLEHLARQFYVSKYHIAHLFKDNQGLSVHQYIIKKRLDLCRDALLSNEEMTETCLLCGFNDYSSFYRAFKKEYGMSPRKYKQQHLGEK